MKVIVECMPRGSGKTMNALQKFMQDRYNSTLIVFNENVKRSLVHQIGMNNDIYSFNEFNRIQNFSGRQCNSTLVIDDYFTCNERELFSIFYFNNQFFFSNVKEVFVYTSVDKLYSKNWFDLIKLIKNKYRVINEFILQRELGYSLSYLEHLGLSEYFRDFILSQDDLVVYENPIVNNDRIDAHSMNGNFWNWKY